jgi:hypothetical protein
MPRAIDRPTLSIRVYEPTARDGTRAPDLAVYTSAKFTRERNTAGNFEITIPLEASTRDLLEFVRNNWMFEFWSEASTPQFLFGGYVTRFRWGAAAGDTALTISGPSYLGWINQRRVVGGTGSRAWAATLGGLETIADPLAVPPIVGDPAALNEIMYHLCTFNNAPGTDTPLGLVPPGTSREHPWFRIPNAPQLSDITDAFSAPTIPDYGIPRVTKMEVQAFLSGSEALNYLSEKIGDRLNDNTASPWFGMPRLSYDIIRYVGDPVTGPGNVVWPTRALYLVFKVPGLGVNRTVGNAATKPIILDVAGGGIREAEYIQDFSEIKNTIEVLGTGNQASRSRYHYEDSTSILVHGRQEDVVDAGQEGNLSIIAQKGTEYLEERRSPKQSVRMTLDILPDAMYGYDYGFDDAVTVYWEEIGIVLNDFVTSVTCEMGGSDDGSLGIQRVQTVVGDEKLARDANVLGRYLTGQKRGLTNLRI